MKKSKALHVSILFTCISVMKSDEKQKNTTTSKQLTLLENGKTGKLDNPHTHIQNVTVIILLINA